MTKQTFFDTTYYGKRFRGGMVKTLALYSKGQRFEPQRRKFLLQQPSGSLAVILVHNQCQHLSLCKDSMLCGISMRRQRENPINRHLL